MSIVTLTDTAKTQVDRVCKENDSYAVSLNLKGGGCAGFEYHWDTVGAESDLELNSLVVESNTGKFAISPASIMFLIGTEIDYVKDLMGATFKINNPNASSSCGCGISVNFDIDKLSDKACQLGVAV